MDKVLLNKIFDMLITEIDGLSINDVNAVINGSCSSHEHYRKLTGRISAFNECRTLLIEYKKNSENLLYES